MKNKFHFYHGSPGRKENADLILDKNETTEITSYNRYEQNVVSHQSEIAIGYSFGCVNLLLENRNNLNLKKIILISPYIFIENKLSPIMKALLKNTFFINILLPIIAKRKIEQSLILSAHPKNVSPEYALEASYYINPKLLSHALLEKEFQLEELIHALNIYEQKKIEIEVIHGIQDQTSTNEQQIKPLEKYTNINFHFFNEAGHALLWTHQEKLKRLIKIITAPKYGYFEGRSKLNNVVNFLYKHKENFPDKNIITWVDQHALQKLISTYNENKSLEELLTTKLPHQSIEVKKLDYIVGILAHEFRNIGIKSNDRVILFLPMSLYMYAAMFALQKIGAIPTFLDSWARRDQMGVSAKVANPKAMISSEKAFLYLNDLEDIKNIKIKIAAGEISQENVYSARLEDLIKGTHYDLEEAVDKEHTALITFTTGSSGTPKGADRSHRFLAAQHYALNRHIPYEIYDKDLPVFPIFSLNNLAAGVETILPAIDVGAPKDIDGLILYKQIVEQAITCTTLSPSLFNHLSKFCLDNKLILKLKRVVTGGAPISRDDVIKMKQVAPDAEILILYGSTEVEPMAHIESKDMLSYKFSDDYEIVDPGVNVGHLDRGLKFKFVKITKDNLVIDNLKSWKNIEVENNAIGELIVSGEHVCEKYFNNEEAFYKSKIVDENKNVWHRTGDLGFIDTNGYLWIVGRVHNAIVRENKYFFPVRAEIILKRFPFVKKAAFLGETTDSSNKKTIAVISLHDNNKNGVAEKEKNEIRRLLEKNDYIVDLIEIVDDIPMDPRHHSKVEYEILRGILREKKII